MNDIKHILKINGVDVELTLDELYELDVMACEANPEIGFISKENFMIDYDMFNNKDSSFLYITQEIRKKWLLRKKIVQNINKLVE